MADHWIENHKRDSWRRQAKASGYRARSAFKLKQIQERFNLLREGDIILDVGCHPGGWAQVATEIVGDTVEGSILLVGDITEPHTQQRVLEELDKRPLHSVISDISPNITGKWDMDQAVAMTLVALVYDFSLPLLCKGGSFVTKLFQGVGVEELINVVKPFFSDVRRFSPHASRNSSSEVYLICRNFMPWKFKKTSILENYETALNLKLGGDDIEEAPEIITSSFSIRKKKSAE
jgi:23S rRNA (uridine2552-2'-O)-methyltransferase